MVAGQYALRLARQKGLANRDVFSEEKVAQLRGDPGGMISYRHDTGARICGSEAGALQRPDRSAR